MRKHIAVVLDIDHDPMTPEQLTFEVREIMLGAFPDQGPVLLKRVLDVTDVEDIDDGTTTKEQ